MIHGYDDSGMWFGREALAFYQAGFNLLLPDARGHGKSQGTYVGMGWHDRLDIKEWICWLAVSYTHLEQAVMAVESALVRGADLLRLGHMQIVSVQLKDLTGSLQVSWYNMPYMRANLKTGVTYVFRGRVVKKRGRMVMEQPEVFTPDSYQALAGSMQPVYGPVSYTHLDGHTRRMLKGFLK